LITLLSNNFFQTVYEIANPSYTKNLHQQTDKIRVLIGHNVLETTGLAFQRLLTKSNRVQCDRRSQARRSRGWHSHFESTDSNIKTHYSVRLDVGGRQRAP